MQEQEQQLWANALSCVAIICSSRGTTIIKHNAYVNLSNNINSVNFFALEHALFYDYCCCCSFFYMEMERPRIWAGPQRLRNHWPFNCFSAKSMSASHHSKCWYWLNNSLKIRYIDKYLLLHNKLKLQVEWSDGFSGPTDTAMKCTLKKNTRYQCFTCALQSECELWTSIKIKFPILCVTSFRFLPRTFHYMFIKLILCD